MSLDAGLLLRFGGVEQGRDDRGRSDPDGKAGLPELRAAFLVRSFVSLAHEPLSMGIGKALEA